MNIIVDELARGDVYAAELFESLRIFGQQIFFSEKIITKSHIISGMWILPLINPSFNL